MASKNNLAKRQGQYFSICCLCFESYDENEKKPKTLSCSHTVCLRCIRDMISRSSANHQLNCPQCRRICKLPSGTADSLPTNMYSLNVLKLSLNQSAQFWCLTCDAFFKPACQYAVECHKVIDLEMEKKLIQDLKKESIKQLTFAVGKREEKQKNMKMDSADLTGELETLALDIHENNRSLQKLRPLLENCRAHLDLSDGDEPVNLLWMNAKELRNVIEVAKEDMENADKLLLLYKRTEAVKTNAADVSVDEDLIQSLDDDNKKEETAEPTAFENINRFSVETLKSSPEPLSCKSLIAHTKAVFDVAFSDDGSFLVSGGKDERLLLWPINSENPQPNEMESTHKQLIHCLAVSPDTKRIFSGGVSRNVVVYDSQTAKEISLVPNQSASVRSLSLQPGNNGDIFAAACYDRTVRIFDTRNRAHHRTVNSFHCDHLIISSVMFSTVDPMILVFAGQYGARVVDIRFPKKILNFIQGNGAFFSYNAQFSTDAKRIVFKEKEDHISVYDPPSRSKYKYSMLKMQVGSIDYDTKDVSSRAFCFAGDNDEFVATASSKDRRLFIWGIPDAIDEEVVHRPLLVLPEHHEKEITRIAFSRKNCSLTSADYGGVINIWTPPSNQQ